MIAAFNEAGRKVTKQHELKARWNGRGNAQAVLRLRFNGSADPLSRLVAELSRLPGVGPGRRLPGWRTTC